MKLVIVTCVWGGWHSRVFKDKALPTILHESNLPSLGMESEFHIYTRGSGDDFRETTETLSKFGKSDVRTIELPDGYKTAWKHACGCTANENVVMFLAPDIVWSKGSFPHLASLVLSGKKMVFMPHLRGTEEAFSGETLDAVDLLAKVKEDAHPVNISEEATNKFVFTRHPEIILWPVKGAWVCRMFAREPLLCPPWMRFTSQNLPDTRINPEMVDVVDSSDAACGVSLAPRDREASHYKGSGFSLNVDRLADFVNCHKFHSGQLMASHPSILRYGEIDEQELMKAVEDSDDFTNQVFAVETRRILDARIVKERRARVQAIIAQRLRGRPKEIKKEGASVGPLCPVPATKPSQDSGANTNTGQQ